MSDEPGSTESALRAWASTVMSGDGASGRARVGGVERAPGRASYDPADVITVFMTARESAKQRAARTGGPVDGPAVDVQPA
jgi:hypothetical protein